MSESGLLSFLFAEAPAVFGFDRSVGPNFDGEDEIAGGASFVEVAFAGEELAELLHQHLGDFNPGLAFGGVGDDAAVFVAPSWDHSGEKKYSRRWRMRSGCWEG